MKKTLLAAATLSTLMASGMANAAFTDADGSGGWTGNLEFNGAITNTNPAWKYQIPEATIAGAKNWNVKRSDGTVDGSNTNFSFTDKNFTVLEGVMKTPAPKAGAGMQPVVTFGNGDNAVVWDTTTTDLASPTAITVEVKKGANPVGTLLFNLQGQIATKSIASFLEERTTNDLAYTSVPDAYNVLKAQPYFATAWQAATGSAVFNDAYTLTTQALASSGYHTSASGLSVKASGFKLTVPTTSIPDAWTATLPISITVK